MGLPSTMFIATIGRPQVAGLTFEAYPSTVRGLPVEFQTATANSTASSLWASVILPPTSAGPVRFHAAFPNSTKTYYCRARHPAGPGYSAGPFTAVVLAKPEMKAEVQRRIAPVVTYKGNIEIPAGSDLWISSGKTAKVGTEVTTAKVTKILNVAPSQFTPRTTGSYSKVETLFRSLTTGVNFSFHAPLLFPPGVALTAVIFRGFYASTADLLKCDIVRVRKSNSSAINLASMTIATTGTVARTTSMSHTVTTEFNYSIFVQMKQTTKSIANTDARGADITYTMPSYVRGY